MVLDDLAGRRPALEALYRSLGFVVEGTERFAAIRDGRYADEYLMARYRE